MATETSQLPSAIALAEQVRRGDLSAAEAVQDAFARLGARDPVLNTFVHVDETLAQDAAAVVQRRRDLGDELPFAGVPIAVKDMEDCRGMPTAYGSRLYRGRRPAAEDSVTVARLRAAGAVPIGKTAAPEFGADTATLSPGWGVTRNPWDPRRTPGGSSGGSASAVAGGIVALATGSDSGGSVRGPAAYCGLVGLKPTGGLVPAPGAGPSRLLAHGAVVTTVADAARHLDVVAGPDPHDPGVSSRPVGSYEGALLDELPRGLRIGWSGDLGYAVVDPTATAVSRAAAEELAAWCNSDLREIEIDWPNPEDAWWEAAILDTWAMIEPGMWPAQRDQLAPVTRRLLDETARLTAPRLAVGIQTRIALEREIAATFTGLDILLTPTMASTPFPADQSTPTVVNGIEMPDGAEPFTSFANIAGLPALSVPAGLAPDGLPVGLQIVGHRFADALLLRLGAEVEVRRAWPRLAPWPPGESR
jgi:aspartyl-tRNA(Asn)/glutamyl-tRNA(Gln) amidotransferase subunit A